MESSPPGADFNPLEVLLEAQASSRASAPYLLEARSARTLSYAELLDDVVLYRDRLRGWGVRRGDRVGLLFTDPMTFSAWFFTSMAMGVWVAPLDSSLSGSNLANVDARSRDLGLIMILSDRDAPESPVVAWRNVLDPYTDVSRANVLDGADESTSNGGVLLASSGTTGTPKVVALPTALLLAAAELIARHNELDVDDRGLSPLPLWHVNAEVVGLLSTLHAGASLVLDDRFHRTGFWAVVDEYEVTWINAVPAIISRLAKLLENEVPARRVRFIRSASAPLAPALFEEFEASTGIPIMQSYGMTEAASQICANPLAGVRKSGSVGPPVGVEVRVVVLEADAPASGADGVGHIEIKGPTVIKRYESAAYDDRFDADGWLRTGDLGYFDDDGYLFIVGRSDDVINRGGEKIYPLEIENVLLSVEGVAQVAVIGEPDEVFGHVPVAYVQPNDVAVLSSSSEMTKLIQRVRVSANEAFSKAHRPAAVKLVDHFPSNATGKIRKGLVREGGLDVTYEEPL
ncbi:MAG TPA: AMP-binding protein [Acidimicrobiales bacterium]|nr:AMP-binding protein [Acidimicrobiales bacterium]